MSIGYACIVIGDSELSLKSCTMKNATNEKLTEIIEHNLIVLEKVIDYNLKNDIKLFRISSDLIPFGSSPVNQLEWWTLYADKFNRIGKKIRESNMRVSLHPGQYTVLNSPNEEVVERAKEDLVYHARVLDTLGVGENHKLILHIGGVYNDKEGAMKRFINNYKTLDERVIKRLVIENDDKLYTVSDALEISDIIKIPVVYDNLHNAINPSDVTKDDYYWIELCKKTWKSIDGTQKIHYSQQDALKKPGSHSKTIHLDPFMDFYKGLQNSEIDIMLEVKDKNLSAIKCINATSTNRKINKLEEEWQRYKYSILESSPLSYEKIRNMLKDKKDYPVIDFYKTIENALQDTPTVGQMENAAHHIWGYFKEVASDKEKEQFNKKLDGFIQGNLSIKQVKNHLRKLAEKYNEQYLLNSYYFLEL